MLTHVIGLLSCFSIYTHFLPSGRSTLNLSMFYWDQDTYLTLWACPPKSSIVVAAGSITAIPGTPVLWPCLLGECAALSAQQVSAPLGFQYESVSAQSCMPSVLYHHG